MKNWWNKQSGKTKFTLVAFAIVIIVGVLGTLFDPSVVTPQ